MGSSDYGRYVAALDQLETTSGGVRRGWSETQKQTLRAAYETLLTRWPWLEGFWVRWAESEFKLGSADAAIAIYRRALDKHCLPYSVIVWVAYLSFLTHVCHTGPHKPAAVQTEFEKAREAIGHHFLSHDFWDLCLEWDPEPVATRLHILDNLTIHQYARIYAQLIEALYSEEASLVLFQSVVPNETLDSHDDNPEERNQLREVIHSRLKLKYELHARRVSAAFEFEKNLRRPFFYPQPLPQPQVDAWIKYIDSGTVDPVQLYRRALIPAALDVGLWLKYLRFLLSTHADSSVIAEAMEAAAATNVPALILYYALWLELKGKATQAHDLYKEALAHQSMNISGDSAAAATAEVYVQYSQFLARQGDTEAAKIQLMHGFGRAPHAAIISELRKYDEHGELLGKLSWSENSGSSHLWRARLSAYPELADETFELAPEDIITEEYLALLARTDTSKFLEIDRMVHRSAFPVA